MIRKSTRGWGRVVYMLWWAGFLTKQLCELRSLSGAANFSMNQSPYYLWNCFQYILPDSDQMTLKGLSDRKIRFNRFLRNDVKCRFDDIHIALHLTYTIFYRKSQVWSMRVSSLLQPRLEAQGVKGECVEDVSWVNAASLQGLKMKRFYLRTSKMLSRYMFFRTII